MFVLLFGTLLALAAAQDSCPLLLNNPGEQQALQTLYSATQGFTWRVNLQWPAAGENPPIYDPCCWIGVSCKIVRGRVHVFEINLAHNNLRGTLPEALANLPFLEKLFVHNNQIGGQLPAAIGRLPNLELLFLSDNRFTGPVPNLSGLRRLQVLYLENNQLQGSFPDISSMPLLEAIDVSNNKGMTGALPRATPDRMKDFRANGCSFSGSLPTDLLRSSTLQSIQVKGNQLSGPVPSISTRSIKILDIADNKLGCFAPDLDLGIDLRLGGNNFLCLPGIARLPGCVNPAIARLVTLCSGAGRRTCDPNGGMSLDGADEGAEATLQITNSDSIVGCDDVFCFIGSLAGGPVQPTQTPGQFKCVVTPTAVGVYSLSLRRADGTVLSASNAPVTVQVRAGCGNNNCNPPNGVCTPDGCVCDQQKWGGKECLEKLCPRNCLEASGNGVCNKQTGVCDCNAAANWGGNDCSLKQVMCPRGGPSSSECSGNGRCVYATGECRCFPQTTTINGLQVVQRFASDDPQYPACDLVECPVVNDQVCSGHGNCKPKSQRVNTQEPCNCINASGYDCNTGTRTCSNCANNELDEKGNPKAACDTFTGQCICSNKFQGVDCRQRACPKGKPTDAAGNPIPNSQALECSGNGVCNRGNATTPATCECNEEYRIFADCSQKIKKCLPTRLPGMEGQPECGGPQQGNCRPVSGTCVCVDNVQRAFEGEDCLTPKCPTAWQNCDPEPRVPGAPKGTCNVQGKCDCNTGWTGDDCGGKVCVLHPDGSECGSKSMLGECQRGSGKCDCNEALGSALDPKTACASKLCPGSNAFYDCTSSGVCEDGVCKCNAGFEGDACQDATPPWAAIIGGIVGAICCVLICAVAAFFMLRAAAIKRIQNQ